MGSADRDVRDAPSTSAPAPAKPKTSAIASSISGAISGGIIGACVQPLDVLRTRMQADAARGIQRGLMATVQVVLQERGIRGLWIGTEATVLRLSLGAGTVSEDGRGRASFTSVLRSFCGGLRSRTLQLISLHRLALCWRVQASTLGSWRQ